MSAAFEDRRPPDATCRVAVEGGEVQVYVFGQGPNALLLLHGGPAVRCDHLQHTHARYADRGYKVVTFDQLGAGRSDRPDDPSLWNIERYCREVEAVRTALSLDRVQIYGHSWGAMLAIEFTLSHPERVKSLVIAHGIANMPFHQREVARLLQAFGDEFLRMRVRREMNGTTDHPEYQASEQLMAHRHVCRLPEWPEEVLASLADWYPQPYHTMIGQEYRVTGNLKDWNRVPDMHRITCPALVLSGEWDALTPQEAQEMAAVLPAAQMRCFPNCAHMPFYECPEAYHRVLSAFWDAHR